MDRPKLDKPRMEMWRTDDQQLAALLDHIDKKTFNVEAWAFRVPALNKSMTYDELRQQLQLKYPPMMYLDAMRDAFLYLPDKIKITKDELFSVFKRFTLNIQERASFIEQQDEYITALESENTDLLEKVKELTEQCTMLSLQNDNKTLTAKVEAYEQVLSKLGNKVEAATEQQPAQDAIGAPVPAKTEIITVTTDGKQQQVKEPPRRF